MSLLSVSAQLMQMKQHRLFSLFFLLKRLRTCFSIANLFPSWNQKCLSERQKGSIFFSGYSVVYFYIYLSNFYPDFLTIKPVFYGKVMEISQNVYTNELIWC